VIGTATGLDFFGFYSGYFLFSGVLATGSRPINEQSKIIAKDICKDCNLSR
jgi:hypothetical protein